MQNITFSMKVAGLCSALALGAAAIYRRSSPEPVRSPGRIPLPMVAACYIIPAIAGAALAYLAAHPSSLLTMGRVMVLASPYVILIGAAAIGVIFAYKAIKSQQAQRRATEDLQKLRQDLTKDLTAFESYLANGEKEKGEAGDLFSRISLSHIPYIERHIQTNQNTLTQEQIKETKTLIAKANQAVLNYSK